MTLKTLAAAAALSVLVTIGVDAATFDFSFDATTASSGEMSLMAVGTLDINVDPGESFSGDDLANISIEVSSDTFETFEVFEVRSNDSIIGGVAIDGQSASFSQFSFDGEIGNLSCTFCNISEFFALAFPVPTSVELVGGGFLATTLQAAPPPPMSALPLPATGLLLLSGIGGIAALKRRKKRAA